MSYRLPISIDSNRRLISIDLRYRLSMSIDYVKRNIFPSPPPCQFFNHFMSTTLSALFPRPNSPKLSNPRWRHNSRAQNTPTLQAKPCYLLCSLHHFSHFVESVETGKRCFFARVGWHVKKSDSDALPILAGVHYVSLQLKPKLEGSSYKNAFLSSHWFKVAFFCNPPPTYFLFGSI